MHGMHAVVGFPRSRPFGPNSPGFDRYPIGFRRACFVRCRFLRRGRPFGPSGFIPCPLRIPPLLSRFFTLHKTTRYFIAVDARGRGDRRFEAVP